MGVVLEVGVVRGGSDTVAVILLMFDKLNSFPPVDWTGTSLTTNVSLATSVSLVTIGCNSLPVCHFT